MFDTPEDETDARTAVARLVLRRFASWLRGFADSSPDYLLAQFILRPGTVRLTAQTLDVSLSELPLGIVLRMSGRDGDQGTIPWLANRRLLVQLPDG